MTEVWLGDKSFKDLNMVLLKGSQHPILPESVDRSLYIAGRNGLYDLGADLGAKAFELSCAFVNLQSAVSLQQSIRMLAKHITDDRGKPRTFELKFDTEPDKFYYARYSGNLPIERLVEYGEFTLPLVAYDPVAYQTELSTEITWDSMISMDNDSITYDDTFSFTINENDQVQVNNAGIETSPIISLLGSWDSLNISSNGKTFVYNNPFSGSLIIDNEKMIVKAGTASMLKNVSGDFIELKNGMNTVSFSGTDIDVSVSFIFRNKYM